jgi:NAD(P)-dependent dehydrogenase (short-subunit alcohol dehydrogenase family)
MAVKVDATSKQDIQQSLDTVLSAWGQVDILINAAGINSATPFFEITEDEC